MFCKTQAFANPTDVASSGVWENVYPARHLVLLVSEKNILHNIIAFDVVFYIAKLWVLADVIANCFCL